MNAMDGAVQSEVGGPWAIQTIEASETSRPSF
jgi:hypothetical protein